MPQLAFEDRERYSLILFYLSHFTFLLNSVLFVTFYNKETVGGDSLLLSRLASTTLYNWDISSLEDGSYDLQLISFCEDGTSRESAIVSGIIDRVNPYIFGQPTPADGVLSPNDEISIRFNETIDAERIIKNLLFIK